MSTNKEPSTFNPGWLTETLAWMTQHGSSILLNWGEDTSAWECSYVSGGTRFTGFGRTAAIACRLAIEKAQAHARGEAR